MFNVNGIYDTHFSDDNFIIINKNHYKITL